MVCRNYVYFGPVRFPAALYIDLSWILTVYFAKQCLFYLSLKYHLWDKVITITAIEVPAQHVNLTRSYNSWLHCNHYQLLLVIVNQNSLNRVKKSFKIKNYDILTNQSIGFVTFYSLGNHIFILNVHNYLMQTTPYVID